MNDLKPCHYCCETDAHLSMDGYSSAYAIVCPDCGARGPKAGFIFDADLGKETAKERWNDLPRRSDSDGLREENARLWEAAIDAAAHLAGAIDLLERGGRKAAPSNRMFDIMLTDCRASLANARKALCQECAADPAAETPQPATK